MIDTNKITYQLESTTIIKDNMKCVIVNRRPQYSQRDKQAIKADIEEQLYAVFCKYAHPSKKDGRW